MVTVCIRKQGGAGVITIPSAILKLLGLEIGACLELDVKDGKLIARPEIEKNQKRYTLQELLKGASTTTIRALKQETLWAHEGNTRGIEL